MQEGEPRKWVFQGLLSKAGECSYPQTAQAIPQGGSDAAGWEEAERALTGLTSWWPGRAGQPRDAKCSRHHELPATTGHARRKGSKGDPSPVSSFCNELYLLVTNERKNEQRAFSLHHSCSPFHWWWEEAKVKQGLSRGPTRAGKNFPRHKARQTQAPQEVSNDLIFLCTHMHLACWEYQSKLIPSDLVMI